MSSSSLRRLRALVLTAVLLVGGSGASALDLILYHLGGAPTDTASHRIAGTETPGPHSDTCVLLDWTVRGPYPVALGPVPPQPAPLEVDHLEPLPPSAPRAIDLFASPQPRSPPVPLA